MKRLLVVIFAVLVCLLADALAQGPGSLNAGSQLAATGSTGAYTFSWWGAAGNTYLMETSDDLINWTYLPVVESGTGSVIQWGFSSTASSLFMKLEYIAVPASELSGAVFNGPDNNVNGLPDDWELFYFGYLGVDPSMDPNGEGFTTLQDYQNGNNPIVGQVVSVGPTVGEYLFHETSGSIAHDISSLHNNGTLSGGAGWSPFGGYDGQGTITFDGTSGEVIISDTGNQVLPVAGAPFSFAFWFAPGTSMSGTTTLVTDEISGASGFECGIDATTSPPSLLFSTPGSSGIRLEAPFQPGAWTQAAVTYDGTNAAIYIDGFQEASGTGALVSNTNTVTLANGLTSGNPFAGAMESLTLYQAVLQPWDVNSLFNLSTTTTGPDPSGIANWWKYQYFGTLNVDPSAFVVWSGSQVTLLEAFQLGLNPIDFYNGQTPTLTIVSGNNQTGSPGPPPGFVPAPLVVAVTDSNGNPLYGAPVTFSVSSGGGQLQSSSTSSASSALTTFADGTGSANAYFQLPSAVSNTSQITVTTGTATGAPQVLFSENSDNGRGSYPSPFAPTNVIGSMNADGSQTITWQNNDLSSPIYVYALVSGTWEITGTLAAGTNSYTASPSMVGSVEIGNNYSPGGSTGGGDNVSGDAGGAPFASIPIQNYTIINISGTLTNSAAIVAASGSANQVAFSYSGTTGGIAGTYVSVWNNGSITSTQFIPGQDTVSLSGTVADGESGGPVDLGGSPDWTRNTDIIGINSFGATLCNEDLTRQVSPPAEGSTSPPQASSYIRASIIQGGERTYIDLPSSYGTDGYILGFYTEFDGLTDSGYVYGTTILYSSGFCPFTLSASGTGGFPTFTLYNIELPSGPIPQMPFGTNNHMELAQIVSVTPDGSVITNWGQLWLTSGTGQFIDFAQNYDDSVQIVGNDNLQVVGSDISDSGSNDCFYWYNNQEQNFASLLPSANARQVDPWDFRMISDHNPSANNAFYVVFDAYCSQQTPQGGAIEQPLILKYDNLGNSAIYQIAFPSGVGIGQFNMINAQGILAPAHYLGSSVGPVQIALPVRYNQVIPNSGFDWVSQPNWLMVPVSSTNQAIAVTPASSTFTLSFSIQASSSNSQLTVSPTSTSSSSQAIIVTSSGTNVGETYQIQVGCGTATYSGTNSAGLGLDVKPMTTGTVAIHAVTQHYTEPMTPPSVSGSFTPGTVCVTWGHVGHTVPTSPDQYNLGETAIITGSDGICHTTAIEGDTQVIPVGQGIPADIVPQGVPSASDLQTYLNQVFGKQGNLFFTVTRNDFSVNYDVLTPINGILDLREGQGVKPSAEENIIEAHASSGVTFNVFYVADYQGLPISGTTADHSSIGLAYFPRKLAYVRNDTVILNCAAHEIGHLLDLGHTDWTYLPSAGQNPAGPDFVHDPSPSDRLMFPTCSGSNTLLLKPEWDIINPNNPP